MLLSQGAPGFNVPVSGVWVGANHLGCLIKLISTPVLGPSRSGLEWGFLPRRQLWTMGVASRVPVDAGTETCGCLCYPFTLKATWTS